jgi:hypothetical protein
MGGTSETQSIRLNSCSELQITQGFTSGTKIQRYGNSTRCINLEL